MELLVDFVARHGHAAPGIGDIVDGFNSGRWVQKQRVAVRDGRRDAARAARLRALPGWVDHTRDAAWEHGFARLVAWVTDNGAIPAQSLVCEDGFTLGGWVCTQRERYRRGRIVPARAARLEAVPGWTWDPTGDTWTSGIGALQRFVVREGHARVPAGWIEDGVALGNWCGTKRGAYKKGTLAAARAAALESLPGWTWSVPDSRFAQHLAALAGYQARHGDCQLPPRHLEVGLHLGAWVTRMRQLHAGGRLPGAQVAALEAVPGWSWEPSPSIEELWQCAWDDAYRQLQQWSAEHGHASPPAGVVVDGRRLGVGAQAAGPSVDNGGGTGSAPSGAARLAMGL